MTPEFAIAVLGGLVIGLYLRFVDGVRATKVMGVEYKASDDKPQKS